MADELNRAITSIVLPALKPIGFRRQGKRDLIRVDGVIVQRVYFQLSAWGGRDFRTTCCANLIPANQFKTLQPGFLLGDGRWLPSLSEQQARISAEQTLRWIRAHAMPFFETTRTLSGYSELVGRQAWGQSHHGRFQQAVALALLDEPTEAERLLEEAAALYHQDGREWAGKEIVKVETLILALRKGSAKELIEEWAAENRMAHVA